MGQSTAHGAVYAGLAALTGTLWPAVLAQCLYHMHAWMATWHTVNDQMDWVQQQQQSCEHALSAHDAKVWETLQARLTPQRTQVLQNFFWAFDTDHQGYLSLENVQNALAYSTWEQRQAAGSHQDKAPDPTHVQALFEALLQQRPPSDDVTPPDRISWVEFVRLLVSLRAARQTA